MTDKALLQIQILEKLGVPLITAAGGGMTMDGPQTAEKLAALLGRAVQTALNLSKAMDIADTDPQADSVKLALAALSASLIAGHYRQTGKLPDDSETRRLAGALETVLSFGDSFIGAAGRLQALDPGPYPADEHQIGIQALNALAPVVNAISAFPYGRPERVLAQEVVQRLTARAAAMRQALVPAGGDDGKDKIFELGLLRALAGLYIACHDAGKASLMNLDEAGRAAAAQQNGGQLPMDNVWQSFETRAGMLEMLGASAMPPGAGDSGARAPQAAPAAAPPPVTEITPSPATPPLTPPVPPPPAAAVESAVLEIPAGPPANPMSFFKPGAKKPAADSGTEQQEG